MVVGVNVWGSDIAGHVCIVAFLSVTFSDNFHLIVCESDPLAVVCFQFRHLNK
jgi:hypothetical protein